MMAVLAGPFGTSLPARGVAALVVLVLAALGLVAFSLMIGTYGLPLKDVWLVLTAGAVPDMARTVVLEFRLPRVLVALICGAMLALSGAVLQGLTRNGLADPSLLGVSQGAALAVVGLIVLAPNAPHGLRPPAAFTGALFAAGLVQWLASGPRGAGPLRLILMGIGLSSFLSALTSTLLTHGKLEDAQSALGWLSGSVNSAGWPEVRVLTLSALVIAPAAVALARPLAPLRFGPDVARGLGISLPLARGSAVLLAVAAAAVSTAAVGPLGFVGLIAPHMAARLARSGPGLHLALSAVTGALVVGLADLAGRSLFAPLQIPAGLVTALIGVPVFAALLWRGPSKSQL